ncbi:hypothetical protein PRIPAC_77447, partial [Pristionchus pacificus]|uniref:Uncharacterized protein n=1 Tax=Pristionchus pacificus TaxID=54126 RepID=A0A2A6CBE8_PRIPA
AQNLSINAVFITLHDENQQVEIHRKSQTLKFNVQIIFPIPFSVTNSSERIRLDTFFSLVFNANEPIQFDPSEDLSMDDSRTRVDVNVDCFRWFIVSYMSNEWHFIDGTMHYLSRYHFKE